MRTSAKITTAFVIGYLIAERRTVYRANRLIDDINKTTKEKYGEVVDYVNLVGSVYNNTLRAIFESYNDSAYSDDYLLQRIYDVARTENEFYGSARCAMFQSQNVQED